MIVIADSGSTKADWQFLDDEGLVSNFSTIGFNPNYHKTDEIISVLQKQMGSKYDTEEVSKVYFYGSGCWDEGRKSIIRLALEEVFTSAEVNVHHDMLAAARATCFDEPGIACIMGTGSNTVLYDGKEVIDNVINLGFILGDEGSGVQLGKKIITAYFYRELPDDLVEKLEEYIPGGKKDILDQMYTFEAKPAVYLATFSKFYSDNISHPYIQELVYDSFEELIRRHVCKYEDHKSLKIHFVGSIAHYFKGILKKVLDDKGLTMGNIIKQPIYNLVKYHMEKGDVFTSEFK